MSEGTDYRVFQTKSSTNGNDYAMTTAWNNTYETLNKQPGDENDYAVIQTTAPQNHQYRPPSGKKSSSMNDTYRPQTGNKSVYETRPASATSTTSASRLGFNFTDKPNEFGSSYLIDGKTVNSHVNTKQGNKKKLACTIAIILIVFLLLVGIIVGVILAMKKGTDNNAENNTPNDAIKLPGVNDVTNSSLTLVFSNVFTDMAKNPSANYTIIVSTSATLTNHEITNTWASVLGLDPQPPYISIYQCQNFFTVGDKCSIIKRDKRQSNINDQVTATIGNGVCDQMKLDEYCNGPLKENTQYYITLKAQNGKTTRMSDTFGPFQTADSTMQSTTKTTSRTPRTPAPNNSPAATSSTISPSSNPTPATNNPTPSPSNPSSTTRSSTPTVNTPPSSTNPTQTTTSLTQSTTLTPQVTTTAPTPVIEIETKNDYSMLYAGTWNQWGSYTVCSVSCDGGTQSRTRTCHTQNSLSCTGTSSQVQNCGTDPCPPTDIYGTWSVWSIWNTCSLTCGKGNQKRTRVCDMTGANNQCVGVNVQTRDCNDISCPDCSMSCPGGMVSPDCMYCECSASYTVQVFSSNNVLLIGVTISPSTSPYNFLATTRSDGYFTLSSQCPVTKFVLQKNGYVTLEIDGTSLGMSSKIFMTKIAITLTVQPQDRMRLPGESVTLCCEVSGSPLPDNFEWFKGGNLLRTTSSGSSSTLELTGLAVTDTGYYSCRANNDYSAITSSEAFINVKASRNDFCPSQPHSKIISLPDGCKVNGQSTFDEGECPPIPCRSYTADNGSCTEIDAYCCGPLSYARVDIPCDDNINITVLMVKTCGCVSCPVPRLFISGTAGGIDGTKLYYGEIISNGTLLKQTTESGEFSFELPIGTESITLLFQDKILKELLDTIYVLRIPRGAEDTQYISVTMLKKGPKYEVLSSQESEISLSSNATGNPIADITIPPNSFFNEDGTPYNGKVVASFGIIDPDDLQSLDSSPGDFSTVDTSGNTQQLETYGMFSFDFETSDGKKLAIPGDITIAVSSDQIGNNSDSDGISNVKLWRINTNTGEWEFESHIIEDNSTSTASGRKKRQIATNGWGQRSYTANIRGIALSTTWFNFDSIRNTACYSKIRVFKNNFFLPSEQIKGAVVSVVVQSGTRGEKSLSRYRASTDRGDNNGYCIISPCKNPRQSINFQFKGLLFATYNNKEVFPVDPTDSNSGLKSGIASSLGAKLDTTYNNTISVNRMDLGLASNGPFYDWEGRKGWPYSKACSNAGLGHNHFRFSVDQCDIVKDTIEYKSNPGSICLDDYYLLWYQLRSHVLQAEKFNALFIKVYTPGLGKNIKIKAVSEIVDSITTQSKLGDKGNNFGLRQACPDKNVDATCVEVKGPTDIACNNLPSGKKVLQQTLVRIRVRSASVTAYKVSTVSSFLNVLYSGDINSGQSAVGLEEFAILIKEQDYGPNFGIYWGKGASASEARNIGLSNCLRGKHGAGGNDPTTHKNWAVTFQ